MFMIITSTSIVAGLNASQCFETIIRTVSAGEFVLCVLEPRVTFNDASWYI